MCSCNHFTKGLDYLSNFIQFVENGRILLNTAIFTSNSTKKVAVLVEKGQMLRNLASEVFATISNWPVTNYLG